jgi:hypothetical protein
MDISPIRRIWEATERRRRMDHAGRPASRTMSGFEPRRFGRAVLGRPRLDNDALLDRRTDNHDDEVGRTLAALRLRIKLAERPPGPLWAGGNRVLFDARCLQTAAFGNRGIGRFAKAALLGARDAIGDDRLVLLVDHGLEELPVSLSGTCRQVTSVDERSLPTFSVLVQPSPMTASADPLIAMLQRPQIGNFDFIPALPTIYPGPWRAHGVRSGA